MFLSLSLVVQLNAQNLLQTFTEPNSTENCFFGNSASNAGDVNGDGYDDLIVGAIDFNNFTGRVYLYFGGEVIDDVPEIMISGDRSGDFFGRSVANAGDLNGDGFDDVAVGADGCNRVYIYFGGNPMDSVADLILTGEQNGDFFGLEVTGVGDANHDGFNDLLVGAYGYEVNKGRAYLYLGGSPMDSIPDLILTGEITGSRFGSSISAAGDVNNDGYDDMLIGANMYNLGYGRAYLFLGGTNLNSTPDLILTGSSSKAYLGSVGSAGDINHDGYSDFMVGAYGQDSCTGQVYLYFGGNPLNNLADITLNGQEKGSRFGRYLCIAGDVNGDDENDLLIGATGYRSDRGRVYVYLGSPGFDTSPDYLIDEKANYGNVGRTCSAHIDINHDGLDEVLLGSANYHGRGEAFLYDFRLLSDQLRISDTTLLANEGLCFNAFKVIEVAGNNGKVSINSGASANYIAGRSVKFLPGFSAHSGSYVHGFITLDSTFCTGKIEKSLLLAESNRSDDTQLQASGKETLANSGIQIKIYPNPSHGKITIECNRLYGKAHVTLFNQLGKLIHKTDFDPTRLFILEMAGLSSGMYYLVVRDEINTYSSKLIITNN